MNRQESDALCGELADLSTYNLGPMRDRLWQTIQGLQSVSEAEREVLKAVREWRSWNTFPVGRSAALLIEADERLEQAQKEAL